MEFFTVVLAAAVRSGTPVLYASLGEVMSERAGVMNLGLEGIMLVGAYAGFAVTMTTGNPWLGIAASFAAGCAITLIHACHNYTLDYRPLQALQPSIASFTTVHCKLYNRPQKPIPRFLYSCVL